MVYDSIRSETVDDLVIRDDYDPNGRNSEDKRYPSHDLLVKDLGRVTEEELAMWERASRVQFLNLFGRFLSYDAAFVHRVVDKMLDDPQTVSKRDYEYFKEIRTKVYTWNNLNQLKGIVGPQQQDSSVSVTVNIDQRQIETDQARRAAARRLLSDFDSSRKYREPNQQLIEGQVLETNE